MAILFTFLPALQTTGDIECIVTVLLLDISESMAAGEAWKQTKTFVKDFLKGISAINGINIVILYLYYIDTSSIKPMRTHRKMLLQVG